jgi:hypothetical protein
MSRNDSSVWSILAQQINLQNHNNNSSSRSKRRKSVDSGIPSTLNNHALLSLAALNLPSHNANSNHSSSNNANSSNSNIPSSFSLIQQVQSQLQLSSMAAALLPSVPSNLPSSTMAAIENSFLKHPNSKKYQRYFELLEALHTRQTLTEAQQISQLNKKLRAKNAKRKSADFTNSNIPLDENIFCGLMNRHNREESQENQSGLGARQKSAFDIMNQSNSQAALLHGNPENYNDGSILEPISNPDDLLNLSSPNHSLSDYKSNYLDEKENELMPAKEMKTIDSSNSLITPLNQLKLESKASENSSILSEPLLNNASVSPPVGRCSSMASINSNLSGTAYERGKAVQPLNGPYSAEDLSKFAARPINGRLSSKIVNDYSTKPLRIYHIQVPIELRSNKTLEMDEASHSYSLPDHHCLCLRIMGSTASLNDLFVVATDLCQLINIRKSNTAKAVANYTEDFKVSMPLVCKAKDGNSSIRSFTVLNQAGIKKLLLSNKSSLAKPIYNWLEAEFAEMVKEFENCPESVKKGGLNPIRSLDLSSVPNYFARVARSGIDDSISIVAAEKPSSFDASNHMAKLPPNHISNVLQRNLAAQMNQQQINTNSILASSPASATSL